MEDPESQELEILDLATNESLATVDVWSIAEELLPEYIFKDGKRTVVKKRADSSFEELIWRSGDSEMLDAPKRRKPNAEDYMYEKWSSSDVEGKERESFPVGNVSGAQTLLTLMRDRLYVVVHDIVISCEFPSLSDWVFESCRILYPEKDPKYGCPHPYQREGPEHGFLAMQKVQGADVLNLMDCFLHDRWYAFDENTRRLKLVEKYLNDVPQSGLSCFGARSGMFFETTECGPIWLWDEGNLRSSYFYCSINAIIWKGREKKVKFSFFEQISERYFLVIWSRAEYDEEREFCEGEGLLDVATREFSSLDDFCWDRIYILDEGKSAVTLNANFRYKMEEWGNQCVFDSVEVKYWEIRHVENSPPTFSLKHSIELEVNHEGDVHELDMFCNGKYVLLWFARYNELLQTPKTDLTKIFDLQSGKVVWDCGLGENLWGMDECASNQLNVIRSMVFGNDFTTIKNLISI
jgi:hypothetical protein